MNPLEAKVDELLKDFDAWFQGRENEPLVRSERAILKTFCYYLAKEPERVKTHGVEFKTELKDGESEELGPPTEPQPLL